MYFRITWIRWYICNKDEKNILKTGVIYLATFTLMSIFLIVLFDAFLMPKYVRMGTGRYMVNVIDKNISYGQKILDSEGYKIVVQILFLQVLLNQEPLLISIQIQILVLKKVVQLG